MDGVLLAGAAVFAAAVAAWTANRRIDKQLAAEAKRLDKQLAHDRWMRELDELRQLVDDAAACGLAAARSVGAYRDEGREALHDSSGRLPRLSGTEREAATKQVAAMRGFIERFEVRFGRGHEIPELYSAFEASLDEAIDLIDAESPSRETLQSAAGALAASSQRYVAFMEAAREYVRVGPPSATSR